MVKGLRTLSTTTILHIYSNSTISIEVNIVAGVDWAAVSKEDVLEKTQ